MLEVKVFRYRQLADDEDNQAEEHTQQEQESECSIDRLDAQHDIVIEYHNRQSTEQDRENDQ